MMLDARDRAVLETLRKIPKENLVLVGGYAVNAYVPPRFSIDCDLVLLGSTGRVESVLRRNGFRQVQSGELPYGRYLRYEGEKEKVSFDLLVDSVVDRDTGILFEGDLFRKYSAERTTIGRAGTVRIKMRVADPELLFAMKFVAGRRHDVRDIFMLASEELRWDLAQQLILTRCSSDIIKRRVEMVRRSVSSTDYRDSLQGPYGRIPDDRFERCKKNLLAFLDRISRRAQN